MKEDEAKGRIIRLFNDKADSFISGEDMSAVLGFSRASVWKYVKKLRNEGYAIDAVSNVGYKLVSSPDKMYGYNILTGLETKTLGRKTIHYYAKIVSTNVQAYELAEEGSPEGTIVVAETQTAGKGRLGRKWISPDSKGIYLSVILRPEMELERISTITLISANAVVRAVKNICDLSNIEVKWPNDILCGGKKVCGILTEIKAQPDSVDFVVLGIGINVNALEEDIPPGGTSLKLETGQRVDRMDLVRSLLKEIETGYTTFQKNGFGPIRNECRELSAVLGKNVSVSQYTSVITGKAIDIDENGALVLEIGNGRTKKIFSGDVSVEKVRIES